MLYLSSLQKNCKKNKFSRKQTKTIYREHYDRAKDIYIYLAELLLQISERCNLKKNQPINFTTRYTIKAMRTK